MNARQMAAMAEATRLTRQGRLLEATALIQQTLASPAVTGGRRMRHVTGRRPVARLAATPISRPPARPRRDTTEGGSCWLASPPPPFPGRGASGLRRPRRPAARP